MIKIEHFQENCIGCHYCVDILPAYYRMDFSQGRAMLIGATGSPLSLILPDSELRVFERVTKVCPTDVIKIQKQ
ncbi:MAG: ferredoxin [Bacteroidales bacterium]|nr:ferredoxin [Bacteroidales bacterium]